MDRVLAALGVTSGDGEGVAGTATSRWSWPLGTRESLMAEPPNRAASNCGADDHGSTCRGDS